MTKTKKKKKQQQAAQVTVKEKPLLSRQVEIGLLITVLLLTLGLRLIRIDSPLLDFHAHRQTQTASNTRGFAEHTFNLFKPTFLLIDANGNAPGATEMEFPIYQYILGLLARVIGMSDIAGRLFSAFLGVGVCAYTYYLTRRYFGTVAAVGAGLFYAISPVGVFFNRTFQPDTLALLGLVGGIYHLADWFDSRQRRQAAIAALWVILLLLIKPPVLLIIGPWIAYEFLKRKLWTQEQRQDLLIFLGVGAFIGILVAAWYIFADKFIFQETGLTMLRGKIGAPIRTTEYWFNAMLYRETISRIILLMTPIGAAVLAAALIPMHLVKRGPMMTALFGGYLLYFIGVAEYNLPHYYYQLPFIPIASIYVGWAFAWAVEQAKKSEVALLAVPMALIIAWAGIGTLSWRTASPWYNIDHAPFIMNAAAKVKEITGPRARIYANNLFFGDFNYYTDSYQAYVRYYEKAGQFYYFDYKYDPQTDEFTSVPTLAASRELGIEYVVWLKYKEWVVKDQLPEGSELLADEQTFALWKLPPLESTGEKGP